MFTLADLRAFARIAELGGVSAAARALRAPKSSVSRSLARLEESVGAVLVERSTRRLRLTDAGLLLQRHARRILDDVGEAQNAVGGLMRAPRGDLRVSAPFTFATGSLAAMLPAFLAAYPEVRVVLAIENRFVDLLAEEHDVAIRIGPLPDSELIARRLTRLALWPCASPAYLAARPPPRTPAGLADHVLIAHGRPDETWRFRGPAGAVTEVPLAASTVIPEPDVVRSLLLAGAGVGLLPDFHAREAVASGALVRLFPEHDAGGVDVHAVYPSHRSLSAKVRVFVDALVAGVGPPRGRARGADVAEPAQAP